MFKINSAKLLMARKIREESDRIFIFEFIVLIPKQGKENIKYNVMSPVM